MSSTAAQSPAAPSPATPRHVTCETSDRQHIAVELEVLRLSPTFDDMYKNLGLEEEGGEFPGTFPVKNIEARVFKKVVDWCKAHKGQPDRVVEKDPFTQESKRFELTDDDRTFFDVPSPELVKLVLAANYLDIRGLYQYGCQAIADLVKGKETLEARHILQQHFDLLRSEIRCTRSQFPWLNQKVDVVGMPVANPIQIPTDVLTTIFGKLTRADLERLLLVSQQFRNIILHNEELPLRPLDEVHLVTNDWTGRRGTLVLDAEEAKRLKFSAVRKLVAHGGLPPHANFAWKDADVYMSLGGFASPATLTRALTDLLFCRKLSVRGQAPCKPHSFLHLPVILSCNHLDLREMRFSWPSLEPTDVVEWLEHEPEKDWDEPRQMDLRVGELSGGLVGVVNALKKAFLSATSRKPYVLRLSKTDRDHEVDEVLSNALGEQLRVRCVADRYQWRIVLVVVERQ